MKKLIINDKDFKSNSFNVLFLRLSFISVLFFAFSVYGIGQNNNPENKAVSYTADSYWFYNGGGITNQIDGKQNASLTWFGENLIWKLAIQPNKNNDNPDWIFGRPYLNSTYPIFYSPWQVARIIGKGDLSFAGGGKGIERGDEDPHMTINANGNIGIGTKDPSQKLQVNGNARFEDSKVFMGYVRNEDLRISQTNLNKYALFVVKGILSEDYALGPKNSWSDFVFNKDYNLKSLKEVEEFIEKNNHLPEIPSAQEIKEDGYSLHDMNVKLLQKVEELTLYAIEQNKKIEALSEKIAQIEKK